MSAVGFSCSALAGTNKVGNLPCDANGYYTMVIGGLNISNSVGDYYSYDGCKDLFEGSSQFMRRISRGALRGEVGHPQQAPGQSMDDYISRILEIRETNVCVHFSEIWLDFDKMKDRNGRAVVAIMSKLIPSGPFGPMLEKSLKNPKENVCFSIRSFTDDQFKGGVKVRNIRNIVTFDNVLEPGISIANKWDAPTLESLSNNLITKTQIQRVVNRECNSKVATENSKAQAMELITSFGWELPKGATAGFTRW
jgi:hypothetical protein